MTEQDKQQIMNLLEKFWKHNAGQTLTEWNMETLCNRMHKALDEIYQRDNTVKPNTAKKDK